MFMSATSPATVCCSARTPPASSIAANATCGSDWKRRHGRSSSPGPPVAQSQASVWTVAPDSSRMETWTLTGRLRSSSETTLPAGGPAYAVPASVSTATAVSMGIRILSTSVAPRTGCRAFDGFQNMRHLSRQSASGPWMDSDIEHDRRLAARAGAGDERAFAELVARHREPLLRYVARRFGPELAEDAVQEA